MSLKDKIVKFIALAMASEEQLERLTDIDRPLSQCSIWEMLEEVYRSGNMDLWKSIPFYITSSSFIAEVYADLILHLLLDCQASLDRNSPIYIVELGAGSGSLSFHLLNELERKRQFFATVNDLDLRYVMADITSNSFSSWLANPRMADFYERGVLDFAVFKPEFENRITTHRERAVLSAETISNPIIVIANYLFDSLRQDAFRVVNHRLEDVLHSFGYSQTSGNSTGFSALEKRESYAPVKWPRYEVPELDAVLRSYEADFENASIIFPLGAFNCLKNLRSMANEKLVLITTDKGFTDPGRLEGLFEQEFYCHDEGIFSYSVNYEAMARYFKVAGGCSLNTNVGFSVETQMDILLPGKGVEDFPLTSYYFQETVVRKNPINYLYSAQSVYTPEDSSNLDLLKGCMGFVATSNYDPRAFYRCADLMAQCFEEASTRVRVRLARMVSQVKSNYYHVPTEYDVPFQIGRLQCLLGDYEPALESLRESMNLFGITSLSTYYAGYCSEQLERLDEAATFYERAAQLNPRCEVTRQAIERMRNRRA
jgi:tetratricopeptide (TPR) repeat protein